jgi:hypothetical protein
MPKHDLCLRYFFCFNVNRKAQSFQIARMETKSPECARQWLYYNTNQNAHEDLQCTAGAMLIEKKNSPLLISENISYFRECEYSSVRKRFGRCDAPSL